MADQMNLHLYKIPEILLASGDLDKGFDLFVSRIIVHSGEEILRFDWDLSEVSHMEIKQILKMRKDVLFHQPLFLLWL